MHFVPPRAKEFKNKTKRTFIETYNIIMLGIKTWPSSNVFIGFDKYKYSLKDKKQTFVTELVLYSPHNLRGKELIDLLRLTNQDKFDWPRCNKG